MQEYTVKVYNDRTEWYQNGKLHRLDGPAIEWADGDKEWFQNSQRHRLDGPTVEWANGSKSWYVNNQRHRLDGPAVEWSDGSKSWYQNDQLHRTDGLAVEWSDGTKEWWIEGEELTETQFNQRVNPQPVELTLDEIAQQFGIPVEQLKIKK
jgi:hypothetical protein